MQPHTIKHDVFDGKYFIILLLNFNTSGCLQSKSNMNSQCLILRKLSAYIEYKEQRSCIFLYSIRQHSIQRKTQAFRVLTRIRAFITHTSGVTVMRPLTCTGNLNQTRKTVFWKNYSIGLLEHYYRAGPCSRNALLGCYVTYIGS